MNSAKFTFEESGDESIEDLIREMKNEILKGVKAKAHTYCFDFERERPMSGTHILWFEDNPIAH